MAREVGAYDAKTRLPQLLRDVERGERITITHRGRAVAELVPPRNAPGSVADAIAAMRRFEPIRDVDPEALADWIGEGRR